MTIQELEEYFASKELPSTVQIDRGTKIVDVRKFVDGHLSVLKHNGEGKAFKSFKDRLMELKDVLDGVKAEWVKE
jgi:hypothetical protein